MALQIWKEFRSENKREDSAMLMQEISEMSIATRRGFYINNFIDFIFDMKISVPKQWQMKKVK